MDWKGASVVIVGLARQGKALARYLVAQGAVVTLNDRKPAGALKSEMDELSDLKLRFQLGGHPRSLLEGTDVLCLSGGVPADLPLAVEARNRGLPVTNDSQIFLEVTTAQTMGITGSAGKSTTTALVGAIGEAAGRRTWIGGNLGRPLLLDVSDMTPEHLAVLELSSFQLELMSISPRIAAVLNITPNHLDRHRTLERYTEAKARLLDYQTHDDIAVLGRDDPGAWALRSRVQGRMLTFGEGAPEDDGAYLAGGQVRLRLEGNDIDVLSASEVRLPGRHNLLNFLAASALAAAAGLPADAMAEAGRSFAGLPHRLEKVGDVAGVGWINDSIATTPERSAAALRTYSEPIVLLAGGRDKGLDWSSLTSAAANHVRHVVAFGEAAESVAAAFRQTGWPEAQLTLADDLPAAVRAAASQARRGDIVLLSPGGTSFDAYDDFEARGEHFRQLVGEL